MEQIVKKLLGLATIVISLVFLIGQAGKLLRPVGSAGTDVAFQAIDAFHSMPQDSIEVIVYGSSHAWAGLDTMELYKQYGIGAYNYGCNWQHINTSALFFEDSLRTQSPKVILIETYLVDEVLNDVDINGEIYYTRGISRFEAKERYLKQCFGDNIDRYLSYYVPFVAFHMNWIDLQKENFRGISCEGTEGFRETMGYLKVETVVPIEIGNYRNFEQRELCMEAQKVLNHIMQICREQDIDVVFYTTPYQEEYHYNDALKKYTEENGAQYINLFEKLEETKINADTDFYDGGHLNVTGARKVADYLGKYITENYEITDMREIDGNLWENNWKKE